MASKELNNQEGVYDSPADAKSASDRVRMVLQAIELASEEERCWREDVEDAVKTYEAEENQPGTAFNLYHANIQTLIPSLYNSTPIPDVRRRFNDDDPLAREVGQILERTLSWSIDQYDFDGFMNDVVFDMALPGRGVGRVSYTPTLGEVAGVEDVVYQEVGCDYTPWASFRHGPARSWNEVPWVAFAHYYTKEAIEELAGAAIAAKVPLDMRLSADDKDKDLKDDTGKSLFKRALVWEFWDKDKKTVEWIAPGFKDGPLKVVEDPLELTGFFPLPRPVMAINRAGKLKPLCEYTVYKGLLVELDQITTRITRLIKQLRPRALSALKTVDAQAMAKADDGMLVEVSDTAMMLDTGGIEKMLHWFPLDPVVKTLAQLYVQRDNVKVQIYEVTGMADIMRGQSDPNETAKAQQLKAQWGSQRIRKRQEEVQRFCRDIFRMKAELIANKFTPEMLQAIVGQTLMITPDHMMLLRDDIQRNYRVDVETDSTIRGDAIRAQEQMSQFVTATGTFMQALAPMIQGGFFPVDTAAVLYQSFCRQFRLGKQAEDALDSLVQRAAQAQAQKEANPPPDPAQQELQLKQAEMQIKAQGEQQKMGLDAQKHEQDMAFRAQEHEQKLALEAQKQQMEFEFQKQQADAQIQLQRDQMFNENHNKAADRKMQVRMKKNDYLQQYSMAKVGKKRKKGVEGEYEDDLMMPLDEITQGLNKLAQSLQQVAEMQMQMMQQMMAGIEQVGQIVAAPAELVRDEAGRPVGARKVMNRTVN